MQSPFINLFSFDSYIFVIIPSAGDNTVDSSSVIFLLGSLKKYITKIINPIPIKDKIGSIKNNISAKIVTINNVVLPSLYKALPFIISPPVMYLSTFIYDDL